MKQPFIEAGEIVTTHGVRGEVKLLPWMDCAEDLLGMKRCRIQGKTIAIHSVRVQKGCCLLKLEGVDTVEAGQALRGRTVELYREDLPADTIFVSELIGVMVYAKEELIGKVEDVLDYPGNKVYVVRGESGEYMIPAVKEFILSTDIANNRMEVKLLEGMRSDED